ncbi:hypothetical protein [Streptomyces chartreusis]|jgi:hypothetical protein|uniref:hypothetical protein n=1 Tax=Streptomyces chartreusis TaxID=1969 RepID=UPI002E170340
MTDSQQNRPSTPEEDIKTLYGRVAKLDDITSALLSPAWGSEAGIIPTDHPLYVGENPAVADEEHGVPVDWQAITKRRERELKKVGEARHRAEIAVAELAQALRLTREYVGDELLPAVEGWSWYDALRRHAPHELAGPAAAEATVTVKCACTGTGAGLNACSKCPTPWPDVPGATRIRPRDDEPADLVDTCRHVEVDGEIIRVRGAGELTGESQAALTEVVRAARRRMINEQRAAMAKYPYEDGDVTVLGPEIFLDADGKVISWKGENYVPQNRLRLAHAARRVKEGQLDGIRRALCDVGLMEDDDPYGHADLEGVIRQAR